MSAARKGAAPQWRIVWHIPGRPEEEIHVNDAARLSDGSSGGSNARYASERAAEDAAAERHDVDSDNPLVGFGLSYHVEVAS